MGTGIGVPALLALVGVVLLVIAASLLTNWRGASDWWIRYSEGQRQLFGYAPVSPRVTGAGVGLLGVLFVAVALIQ